MSRVAQLDKDGFFLGESEDYGGPMPHGCINKFPSTVELQKYQRWRFVSGAYVKTEDYRGVDVHKPDGTAYRPDTWGPLPEGHSLTPQEKKPSTPEEVSKDFENRIQQRLDDFARTLTYDSILSACTYATSSIEMYSVEGQYCVEARDATWAKAYELMQTLKPQAEAGGAIPSWEEIAAQLPLLSWPAGSRGYKVEV